MVNAGGDTLDASKIIETVNGLGTLLELLKAKHDHYKELYSHANLEHKEEEAMGFYWLMVDTDKQRQKVVAMRGELLKLHSDFPDFEKVYNSMTRKAETILKETGSNK